MENTLKGSKYLYNHSEKRAQDLMDAFQDKEVKAIISMIGGDDTVRLIPYINYDIIKKNPKIFMGYSDTTANHFMLYKAGITSYYGPAILSEFAENGAMHEYTKEHILQALFTNDDIVIEPSPKWTCDSIDWTDLSKDEDFRKMENEKHGFEVLQGEVSFEGEFLGGCIEVLEMIVGTEIWPKTDGWKGKILFLETSEDKPSPDQVACDLRHLVALGIIDNINGIIVGKPNEEIYDEEYKKILKKVIGDEAEKKIYQFYIMSILGIVHQCAYCHMEQKQK